MKGKVEMQLLDEFSHAREMIGICFFCRIYELKDNKENIFLMEHNAKLELLHKIGVLENDGAVKKTHLPRMLSEDLPSVSDGHDDKMPTFVRQQSVPS